jgi:hypothetical protein
VRDDELGRECGTDIKFNTTFADRGDDAPDKFPDRGVLEAGGRIQRGTRVAKRQMIIGE